MRGSQRPIVCVMTHPRWWDGGKTFYNGNGPGATGTYRRLDMSVFSDSSEMTVYREGFRKLLKRCGLSGRMPGLVASRSRNTAFDNFSTAHSNASGSEYVALLIDSEGRVSDIEETWEHLRQGYGSLSGDRMATDCSAVPWSHHWGGLQLSRPCTCLPASTA